MNTATTEDEALVEAEGAIRPTYKELSDDQKTKVAQLKEAGVAFHQLISSCPASRESSLAKTKLEESVMWAVKGVTK